MSVVYECDFCHKTQKTCATITFNTHEWSGDDYYPRSTWGLNHTFDCCETCKQKVLDALGIEWVKVSE